MNNINTINIIVLREKWKGNEVDEETRDDMVKLWLIEEKLERVYYSNYYSIQQQWAHQIETTHRMRT